MKTKHIISLVVLFSFFCINFISAQNVLLPYEESFDSIANNWETSLHTDGTPTWSWGTAEDIGEDVFRILSSSGGGAMVMIDEAVDNIDNRVLSTPVISIDANGGENTHLRFNQYLKMGPDDLAYIRVETNSGLYSFQLNLHNMLDGETSEYDMQDIDISSATTENSVFSISFVSETTTAVWIIDDIEVYDAVNTTEPIGYIGDSLKAYNIPYDLDSTNWPYVPHQIVVDFKDIVISEGRKDTIRADWGFVKIASCCEGDVELWSESGEALNGTIGILEKTKGAEMEVEVDDTDLNKYNFNELLDVIPTLWNSLDEVPPGVLSPTTDAILIAILDTGIDYEHDDLKAHIWNNPNATNGDCYPFDYIGWNFVHENNNPGDDHSHGTHVAGIIVENLKNAEISDCDYRIVPLKTHTSNGVATLFNVTCATYYSIKIGASVINDSWGFYGASSDVLKNAMQKASDENILIVSASGNDNKNLDSFPQYPACDDVNNIITVGSHKSLGTGTRYYKSSYSNYSATQVDILALGDSILSTTPGNTYGMKSGTSMSSPAVTAALFEYFCNTEVSRKNIKDVFLTSVRKEPSMVGDASSGGAVLSKTKETSPQPPNTPWWEWCKNNWALLCCGLLILLYMSICWWRTKSFFRFTKKKE